MFFSNERASENKKIIRVAAVQIDPQLRRKNDNLIKVLIKSAELAGRGVTLAVFPELATTGYIFN